MKKNIWIVDDDHSILEVVKILLEQQGYQVTVINDPQYLQQQLQQDGHPDLLIMDVYLAGENGIEVVKRLKQQEDTKNIKVLLMTADIHIDEKAREAQADGFIHKPFAIEELTNTIGSFFNKQ